MKRILTALTCALLITDASSSCRDELLKFNNLKSVVFTERPSIIDGTNTLLANANGDAYQLSLPLLISAQLGDAGLYQQSLDKIQESLRSPDNTNPNQNSFRAWMYGRMLMASKSIGDTATMDKTKNELKNLLNDKNTMQDRFTAWAWGYLASLNNKEYHDAKNNMEQSADKLTTIYMSINSGNASEEKKQEARSDALWAWVMAAQAAANSDDKQFYQHALDHMQIITETHDVSDALLKGLLRTSASNDYPAWAIAMTRVDAVTILDKKLFAELENTLKKSIEDAINAQAKPETMLAQVNRELANERNKIYMQCEAHT